MHLTLVLFPLTIYIHQNHISFSSHLFNNFSFIMFKLLFLVISLFFPFYSSSSSSLHPLVVDSEKFHLNSTAISDFRLLNRRSLISCPINLNPYIKLEVISKSKDGLLDEEFLDVVVSGVSIPSIDHWVALITPSNAKYIHYHL